MTPSKEIDPPSHRRASGASSTGSCAIWPQSSYVFV